MVSVVASDFRRTRRMRALAYGRKRQGEAAPVWCVTWLTPSEVEQVRLSSYLVARGVWQLLRVLDVQPVIHRKRPMPAATASAVSARSLCHA